MSESPGSDGGPFEKQRDWIVKHFWWAFMPTGFVLIATGLACAVTFSPWWLLLTAFGALVLVSIAWI